MRPEEASQAGGELLELRGALETVRFHNADSGWTVARFRVEGYQDRATVVGHLADPAPDQELVLFGRWATHPRFGEQFQFERYQLSRPATRQGIERYLASGIIKGIGPQLAAALVGYFGEEVLRIIDEQPHRLFEVPGIGERKAEAIRRGWQQQKAVQNIMLFLQGHGVSSAYALRIYRHYGDRAVEVVERNPYQLAQEVSGIGFKTADRIARTMGLPSDSPERIEAGLIFALQEASAQGHVFLPRAHLLPYAQGLLEVEEGPVQEACARLIESQRLVGVGLEGSEQELAVYLPEFFHAEQEVARHLGRLLRAPGEFRALRPALEQWQAQERRVGEVQLSAQQAAAAAKALEDKVLVITGGPGVGKTTVTKAIVDIHEASGCRVELASPTGRAAKRLSEMTRRPARTIHRLLELDPETWRFRRDENNPLLADLVIVDEASMLDLLLARHLLAAVPEGARLVLVGDADQLPSVGPGLVLRDLIGSGRVPVARLTEIFRQEEESGIVVNAHRVNQGMMPRFARGAGLEEDCCFLVEDDPEAIVERVKRLVETDLRALGFDPREIQVLSPMNKRALGTARLNQVLQSALNPPRPGRAELKRGEKVLREGDRVIQTVNNYKKDVFNGDVGRLLTVDRENQELVVVFPEQPRVSYDLDELDQLELAYALSVHKSQGSEYPAVIIICHSSQYVMLQRNLLYTALTRAQKKAVLIGNRPALWRAVRNDQETRRYSRLRALVAGGN
jgi:exodeoxyribonuclease V alpha subunit